MISGIYGYHRKVEKTDSDIGVTNIAELRYHSTTTPISEYQYSDIDSDIGGAVISEVTVSS